MNKIFLIVCLSLLSSIADSKTDSVKNRFVGEWRSECTTELYDYSDYSTPEDEMVKTVVHGYTNIPADFNGFAMSSHTELIITKSGKVITNDVTYANPNCDLPEDSNKFGNDLSSTDYLIHSQDRRSLVFRYNLGEEELPFEYFDMEFVLTDGKLVQFFKSMVYVGDEPSGTTEYVMNRYERLPKTR